MGEELSQKTQQGGMWRMMTPLPWIMEKDTLGSDTVGIEGSGKYKIVDVK